MMMTGNDTDGWMDRRESRVRERADFSSSSLDFFRYVT